MNISQLSEQSVKLAVAGSPEAEAVGLRERSQVNQAEERTSRFVSPWGFVLSGRAVHGRRGLQGAQLASLVDFIAGRAPRLSF
jgi:hypothetical protein